MKKAMVVATITFFFGYVATKKVTSSCRRFFFFSFFARNKAMTVPAITFFFLVLLQRRRRWQLLSLPSSLCLKRKSLFLWSFWSSSLELTINNEMVVFLMLKVVMTRGRRSKKGGGDLELHNQNIASPK
jgi:hypothetical protein